MISNYDGDQVKIPESLPMLPVRDIVVFPYMILPLFIGRDSSIKAVEDALAKNERLIFLASQKDISDENPEPERIFNIGTVAVIMRMRRLPDGRVKILVQGVQKAMIEDYETLTPYMVAKISPITEALVSTADPIAEALMRNVRDQLEKVISLGKIFSPDILMVLDDIDDAGRMADLVASNLGLKVSEAQAILEITEPVERLKRVHDLLNRELEILAMQAKIRSQARDEMSKSQKEYFLREQIKQIKSELGDHESSAEEFEELKEKVKAATMPSDVEEECLKQVGRLERMHPDASEASILRTYLDWMIDMPWNKHTEDRLDIKKAQEILDEDHYELDKVKERILEFLAVRKMKGGKMKGPILCFYGPPGVGKTSLGRSIAKSLGREFIRISLGGVKDEAEIRGHRRTYVGAMPGRFIQGLRQTGSNNPVMILDEIDKIGSDFRGDPSSALLEVLDPEQNNAFRDHYLNSPFDLSNVMFIATSNDMSTVPQALRDRMEVIEIPGYTEEDKLEIAKRYLTTKQQEENGITDEHIEWTDEGLKSVIAHYTREAGLRNLERAVGNICRKTARYLAEEDGAFQKVLVTPEKVIEFLGPPKYLRDDDLDQDEVGVATGLAWTQAGGEILYVETTHMKGKGAINITGQLGDVMKESAQASIGFIRSKAHELGIDESVFQERDFHIHFPAGAVPKDGPSAGITVTTALVSLLTGNPVRKDVAMTGEITLTGKVLPIGGLKEKALAALRRGIKTVIVPYQNKKDMADIPEKYRKDIEFVFAKTIEDVLNVALLDPASKKGRVKKKASGGSSRKKSGSPVGREKQSAVESAA